jgi:hypothetical protein
MANDETCISSIQERIQGTLGTETLRRKTQARPRRKNSKICCFNIRAVDATTEVIPCQKMITNQQQQQQYQ